MRLRPGGGLDLATGALILGGAGFIVAAIVAGVAFTSPSTTPATELNAPSPAPTLSGRTSETLPADRVATILSVDVATGAGAAVRGGDHVDVLGYSSRQITGADAMTRVLVQDVPVLSIDRSGGTVALTLALPTESALLLQEAQALGVRPFIALRPFQATTNVVQSSLSDTDVVGRITGHR